MTRVGFAVLMVAIAAAMLTLMWIAWRGRRRRDSGIAVSSQPEPAAEVIAEFSGVPYVSTTPVGAPFERVAIPALSYKGAADLAITGAGIRVQVTGEDAVFIPRAQLRGVGSANGRVGKIVERDGLALLRWVPESAAHAARELESSFRFTDPTDQRRFSEAVETLLLDALQHESEMSAVPQKMNITPMTQEDA